MTSKYSRVSGFNPRLVMWWIKGCRTPTSVTFPTRRFATRTRQNLYALRNAMIAESHHAATLVERGERIHRPVTPNATGIDDPHILIIRPANFDMNDLLDEAGINLPELDEPDLTDNEPADDGPTVLHSRLTTFDSCPRPFDYANAMGKDNDEDDEDE